MESYQPSTSISAILLSPFLLWLTFKISKTYRIKLISLFLMILQMKFLRKICRTQKMKMILRFALTFFVSGLSRS